MESSWVAMTMLGATVLLALVTVTATIINYFVFRTVVDPDVVLYVDNDRERPSILVLVVENVGRGLARNVRFSSSRQLPYRAFGTNAATAPPAKLMTSGPIIDGIPNLGPGGRRVITWGQYAALNNALQGERVKVTIRYESKSWHAFSPAEHSAEFELEVGSFAGTDASEGNIVRARRQLERIAAASQNMQQTLRDISDHLRSDGEG